MNENQLENEMLNPLTSNGKQMLADLVSRYENFNILQTTEEAGDIVDLLDDQFYQVLQNCDDAQLGLLKSYLEGKIMVGQDYDDRNHNVSNARNILSYFNKLATIDDQRKCLEIVANLLLEPPHHESTNTIPYMTQEANLPNIENRPVSRARTSLGMRTPNNKRDTSRRDSYERPSLLDVYETTYERQFPRPLTATSITRPRSVYPSGCDELSELRKHYHTSYESDFYKKEQTRTAPIRSGSGSGNRRHNPHPLHSFMFYQLPRSQPFGLRVPQLSSLGDKDLQSAIKGKTSSTYFNSYLGLPQGVNIKSAFGTGDENEKETTKLRRSASFIETTTGRVHQFPQTPEQLKNDNFTRYGCNKDLAKVAESIVPTANKRFVNPGRGKVTTYDTEYVEKRLMRDIPTRRPRLVRNDFEQVPHELYGKPFIANREEMINKARERSDETIAI